MSRKFLTPIDLAQNEIQNPVAQNLASAPSTPLKGQFYYNSTANEMYWWDGTTWQSAKGGTINFGNVTAEPTFGSTSSNGIATTAARSDHAHGNPVHDDAAHAAIHLNALAPPNANVNMNAFRIIGMQDPSSASDAATKQYVDNLSQGLDAKNSCRAASVGNLTLSGTQTIDGITCVANDRILVKDQTTQTQNGIYVMASGAWTRATDNDASSEFISAYTWIEQGAVNGDTGWLCNVDSGFTLGAHNVTWIQFSGAAQITAGLGLTKTGNTLDVGAGTGITVAADTVGVNFAGTGAATTASKSDHDHSAAYPPITRTIGTTAPLTGGGDLSANRTLAITSFAGSAAGAVPVSPGGSINFLRADGTWSAPVLDTTAGDVRYTRKFSQNVGGATSVTVPHNLGTRDVQVQVYRVASPYDTVECDVERVDTNNVTLRFTVAPAASEYRAVVFG